MGTRAGRRAAGPCLLALTATLLTACGGGGSDHTAGPASGAPVTSTAAAAVRWWSDANAAVGSTIDPAAPLAVAAKLHASRSDYCTMLRQTVHAGKSILPGVTAQDPALLLSTRAFVGEIQAVAPAAVSAQWKVLGGAVVTLVASGGDAARTKAVDAAAVQRAATAVAADARTACSVDLSGSTR